MIEEISGKNNKN